MKIEFRYHIKLTRPDGTLYRLDTSKRLRVVYQIRQTEWARFDLRVLYYVDGKMIGENRGVYTTSVDVERAFTAFVDPEIVPVREAV